MVSMFSESIKCSPVLFSCWSHFRISSYWLGAIYFKNGWNDF